MTTQEENQYIHNLLPELVREPVGYDLLDYEFPANPDVVEVMADRLEAKGLVKIPDPKQPFHLNLTTKGQEIGERPDGYLGYLEELRQRAVRRRKAKAERDKLERTATEATIAAARATVSSARAAWVAAGFSLLSILISLLALWQANN